MPRSPITLIPLLAACHQPSATPDLTGDVDEDGAPSFEQSTNSQFADLAWRYLYEETDDAGSRAILEEVQALSIDETRVFVEEIKKIEVTPEYTTPQDQWMHEHARDYLLDYMEAEDINASEVTSKDMDIVFEELTAVMPEDIGDVDFDGQGGFCAPGWAICSTVSFTTTIYGASCASGCTRATGYDRRSNSACEFGACDYRVEFPTSSMASTVDGTTSAADCVILYYGGFIARSSSGRTQVGYGIAGPTSCWTTGATVSGYLQVR